MYDDWKLSNNEPIYTSDDIDREQQESEEDDE